MEIERKFLVRQLPADLDGYPSRELEQGYLSVQPVVRVRRDGGSYYLTCKGKGKMAHEELEFPLTEESYLHLLTKADGRILRKTRTCIPFGPYTIELDRFHGELEGRMLAEVEFPTEEEAIRFTPPAWFGKDVTEDRRCHNAWLASEPELPAELLLPGLTP